MKKSSKLLSAVLILVLLLSVVPSTALALGKAEPEDVKASEQKLDSSEAGEVKKEEAEEKEDEKDTAEKVSAGEAADSEPEVSDAEAVTVSAEDESFFAEPGSVVFNNGGVVYNNNATIYNNGGTVYNNLGTVYNNLGTVYANGGTVYNNGGTVYDNGAEIYSHDGEPESNIKDGFYRVKLMDDYKAYIDIEGSETDGPIYLAEGESCTVSLKPGYALESYELSSGEMLKNEDGSYTLSSVSENAELKLEFELLAPQINLEEGTYFEAQSLELSAAADAEVYYTLDGSEPSDKSSKYTEPIELKEGAVVKALAVSADFGESEISEAEIAIAEIKVPEFKKVKKGYEEIEPKAIEVKCLGDVDAEISKVSLSGENSGSFILNTSYRKEIPAGTELNDYWTVVPLHNLDSGEYTAVLKAESENGQFIEREICLIVK